ncbi:MAG: response regulator [Alphaproteobacteria bacterium]
MTTPDRFSGKRILVADDEPSVRTFVVRALESAGADVVAVENGLLAVEALPAGPWDLLITDIRMPEMDGISLALKCGADHPGLPILMMTGYATEQQRAVGMDALIHAVLDKPFTLQNLLDSADLAMHSV